MGDNGRNSFDPCESGHLVLFTEDNTLDCFLRGLREGRRKKDMDYLILCFTEYTQEIAAGVVDMFQCCLSKRIQWKTLSINITDQNRFLHLILSEARKLQQFKEVRLSNNSIPGVRAALTNETAIELRAMMSSGQGLERLRLSNMQLLPGVLSTLSQGLRAN
jgi:hypothetical protein